MPLFIDCLPLHCWTDNTQAPPRSYWSIALPVLVSEPGLAAPPALPVQRWFFDTGSSGDAFAWRHHLIVAGLDPDQNRGPGQMVVTASIGARSLVPIREADLWLVSNVPALRNLPCRLSLERGIPFRNVVNLPDPQLNRPLIGMRAFRRAGLRVEIDFANDTVSVWVPDPPRARSPARPWPLALLALTGPRSGSPARAADRVLHAPLPPDGAGLRPPPSAQAPARSAPPREAAPWSPDRRRGRPRPRCA